MKTLGIVGESPSFRYGLEAALSANGWSMHHCESLHELRTHVTVLAIAAARSDDPSIVNAVAQHPTVVALLPSPAADDYVEVLRAGAAAVLDVNTEPRDIVRGVDSAAEGHARVPLTVIHRLAAIARSSRGAGGSIGSSERVLLALLARGEPVRAIARALHWSERAVHRALGSLYHQIGVNNRDQAVAWAARNDLIDDDLALSPGDDL